MNNLSKKVKQKTMPKPKVTKPKVVSGGVKRRSVLKTTLISVVIALVLTAVGYYGYGKYQEHTLKAHAANWTKLSWSPGSSTSAASIWACKTTVSSGYGKYYKVQVLSIKQKGYNGVVSANSVSNGMYRGSWESRQWWGDFITVFTAWLADSRGDGLIAFFDPSNSANTYVTNGYSPSQITNC